MTAKKGKDEKSKFDFELGGLGGIFGGIGKLVELADKLKEAGGEINKEGTIDLDGLKKGMKGVYGFSVKSGTEGKTVVEPFGNIKKTPKGPKVEEVREPMTDVFDEKDKVMIIAEMPGISKKDISLELKGDILEISAASGQKKYSKEVLLETKSLKAENMTSTYKNGILEINIKK
jgi:HSP20 family protein